MPEANTKRELRTALRRPRQALTQSEQDSAAQAVLSHLNNFAPWHEARRVALYLANDGELNPQALIEDCWSAGRGVYLPCLDGKSLTFAQWQSGEHLTPNRYGIGEPVPTAPRLAISDLDILCLPLVAFDRRGTRLGMGGGYYDRALAQGTGPLRVGLAHHFQEVPALTREPWDQALDYVVTDRAILPCTKI